ncbi:GAF domain-containing protein [Piscinibacter gummiphilus]|uniref:GAF domain-containing protein n=1 Tax=Piscinibacter gummiphilus TaxID=946333 RepID=UPI002A4E1B63|nr:GAF domain-containing protein [Piscinibacter gummiphilus]
METRQGTQGMCQPDPAAWPRRRRGDLKSGTASSDDVVTMIPAPIPNNDAQRLQALYQLLILDTPPEARFDRIVAFAADEFDMPVAQISLIDHDRQWAKARVGIEPCEMPRGNSVCGHLLDKPQGLVVPDLTADERFHDNTVLIDEVGLRFYAGSPLVMPDGHVMGALCVMDRRPREFDATDRAILDALRDLVVMELAGQGKGDDAT